MMNPTDSTTIYPTNSISIPCHFATKYMFLVTVNKSRSA